MSIKESYIEKIVTEYASKKGMFQCKFSSPSQRGAPDRMFITSNGGIFFIEFKSPTRGSCLSKQQEVFFGEMMNRHCDVFVVNNIDTGKAIIDDFDKFT